MVRLNRGLNGSVIGVDKFIFATACTMGDVSTLFLISLYLIPSISYFLSLYQDASWNLRATLQHTWRDEASRWTKFNVTVFQVWIQLRRTSLIFLSFIAELFILRGSTWFNWFHYDLYSDRCCSYYGFSLFLNDSISKFDCIEVRNGRMEEGGDREQRKRGKVWI